MSMAEERTRSLRWAHELLEEIIADESLDGSSRASATDALRRFPSPAVVSGWIEADVSCIPADAADAIEQTGRLLRTIHLSESCSDSLRLNVTYALRHFPQPEDAGRWTRGIESRSVKDWLSPEAADR